MRKHLFALLCIAFVQDIAGAQGETYPSKPVTLVVPFAAGGPVDTLARFLTARMQTILGQSIIIENVTGAGGSIGVGRVAHAAPDGYTLVEGIWITAVVNGAIFKLNYDVFNDFEPVALLTNGSQMVVIKKANPANNLTEFIAWLKANPDKASAGTAGVGSPQHIFGLQLQRMTDTRFQFVHYRGGAPATQDLVAGNIDLVIADQVTSLPQIKAGTIKGLAYTGTTRLPTAPDVPTVAEAGLPGFTTSVWNGIWAPKGTPKPIVDKLNAAIVEALSDQTARDKLATLGQIVVRREQQSAETLRVLHKAEIEKWWPIIKAAGIMQQ
jgi:tripartite-type tricarboxylate transporter receptor subunit TctC